MGANPEELQDTPHSETKGRRGYFRNIRAPNSCISSATGRCPEFNPSTAPGSETRVKTGLQMGFLRVTVP